MFNLKRLAKYLATGVMPEMTALDESLAEHDRKYHPDGYKEGDSCNKREEMAKNDDEKIEVSNSESDASVDESKSKIKIGDTINTPWGKAIVQEYIPRDALGGGFYNVGGDGWNEAMDPSDYERWQKGEWSPAEKIWMARAKAYKIEKGSEKPNIGQGANKADLGWEKTSPYGTETQKAQTGDGSIVCAGDFVTGSDGYEYEVYGGPDGKDAVGYTSKRDMRNCSGTGPDTIKAGTPCVQVYSGSTGGSGWFGYVPAHIVCKTDGASYAKRMREYQRDYYHPSVNTFYSPTADL